MCMMMPFTEAGLLNCTNTEALATQIKALFCFLRVSVTKRESGKVVVTISLHKLI